MRRRALPASASWILAGYVALWIVEGALRKWVPGTSLIFYVFRDVYAVGGMIWLASSRGAALRRVPWWAVGAIGLLGLWGVAQLLAPGAPPPAVVAFGFRSYIAPALFALLCYRYADTRVLHRCVAVISAAVPLELLLTVAQVVSPPDAFINREVGGGVTLFINAGTVRATGTFSAPSGLTAFLLIALAVALWWTFTRNERVVGWLCVGGVLAMVALGGSRGAVLNSGILLAVYILFTLARPVPGSARQVVPLVVLLAVTLVVVSVVLPGVLASFITRFNQASHEENTGGRLFDGFLSYLGEYPDLLGTGMGVSSNAGIALGSSSAWIENDSLRWVAELGVLGWLLALARTIVAVALLVQVVRRLRRDPPGVTMTRIALITLFALGSVNGTPTGEGSTAILVGFLIACGLEEDGPPVNDRVAVRRDELVTRR